MPAPPSNVEVVSQTGVLVVSSGTPNARVSQAGVLAVDTGSPKTRVSQEGVLAAWQGTPKARVSQAGLLVIVPNITGGPFPHYIRRLHKGGMISMG